MMASQKRYIQSVLSMATIIWYFGSSKAASVDSDCMLDFKYLNRSCGEQLRLWNTSKSLTLNEPFDVQISRFDSKLQDLGCQATVSFWSCVNAYKSFCPHAEISGTSLEEFTSYVGSQDYIDRCFKNINCPKDQTFPCICFGVQHCQNVSFACDGMQHCDDALDESNHNCGCNISAVRNCFASFSENKTNGSRFPPVNLTSNITSQLLQLNEAGADLVCRALLCYSSLAEKCNPGIPNLSDEIAAFAFTNSPFYNDFCLQNQRNLSSCDLLTTQSCLDDFRSEGKFQKGQLSSSDIIRKEEKCSSLETFDTCFKPFKSGCEPLKNSSVSEAFGLIEERKEYCRYGNACIRGFIKLCLPILESPNSGSTGVQLEFNSSWSSQIARFGNELERSNACNQVVAFRNCLTNLSPNCSTKDAFVMDVNRNLSRYFESSDYKEHCLDNVLPATCKKDEFACRRAWRGKVCISNRFHCDNSSECDDGLDEKDCVPVCLLDNVEDCLKIFSENNISVIAFTQNFSSLLSYNDNSSYRKNSENCDLVDNFRICTGPLEVCEMKFPLNQTVREASGVVSLMKESQQYNDICKHWGPKCNLMAVEQCVRKANETKPKEGLRLDHEGLERLQRCVGCSASGCNFRRIPAENHDLMRVLLSSEQMCYTSQAKNLSCFISLVIFLSVRFAIVLAF